MKLGSFTPSPVLSDIASFMEIEDAKNLSLASPRANTLLNGNSALKRTFEEVQFVRLQKISKFLINTQFEKTITLSDYLVGCLDLPFYKATCLKRYKFQQLLYIRKPQLQKEGEKMNNGTESCFGIIGYQEMAALLQYYQAKEWTSWKTCLCKTNDGNFIEFKDIFIKRCPRGIPNFGISLERTVTGVVDNAVIPKEIVDENTVEEFKGLVQALDSKTPIESVVQNRISLERLRIDFWEDVGHNYLQIRTSIKHAANFRNETSQEVEIIETNLDQSSFEDIFVKIMKTSISISSLDMFTRKVGNYNSTTMSDRLFSNLLEHAADTVIGWWFMDLQLSPENLARLRENRTTGIFQNLRLKDN